MTHTTCAPLACLCITDSSSSCLCVLVEVQYNQLPEGVWSYAAESDHRLELARSSRAWVAQRCVEALLHLLHHLCGPASSNNAVRCYRMLRAPATSPTHTSPICITQPFSVGHFRILTYSATPSQRPGATLCSGARLRPSSLACVACGLCRVHSARVLPTKQWASSGRGNAGPPCGGAAVPLDRSARVGCAACPLFVGAWAHLAGRRCVTIFGC